MAACHHAPKKKPHFLRGVQENGFNSATTDTGKVDILWAHFPEASVGVKLEGIAALDIESVEGHGVNGYACLEQLETELGTLPRTRTHGTASGGEHRLFLVPDGVELTNRTGDDALAPGVELRANGGILVPPSPGYTVKDKTQIVELPRAWVELARKKTDPPRDRGDRKRTGRVAEGERIPRGTRHGTLASIAGRLHDGTRDLAQLTEELLAINEARCDPPIGSPGDDPLEDVERIARSIYKKSPCKPRREQDPKVAEIVEEWERFFWERYGENFKGLGGQSDRDLCRQVFEKAKKFGRLNDAGEVEFDETTQEMALAAGISRPTVYAAARRLREKIGLRRDTYHRKITKAGRWVLPPPATTFTTHNNFSPPAEKDVVCVVKGVAPGVVGLETPVYRHFGPIGKGKGGVQLALEAFGPMSAGQIAEVMGYARVRDLRRLHLAPMVEEGRVEFRDGVYALPGDHRERCEEALERPYGRTQKRRVRRYSSSEARHVVVVAEFGRTASQRQREEDQRRRYAVQRELFLERVESEKCRPEEDRRIVELLNVWDEEQRSADGYVSELEKIEPEASPTAGLTPDEMADLEAVLEYERRYEPFGWTRADWKGLFYKYGRWPDPETSERIKAAYEELGRVGEAA